MPVPKQQGEHSSAATMARAHRREVGACPETVPRALSVREGAQAHAVVLLAHCAQPGESWLSQIK